MDALAVPDSPQVIRAVVESFDPATHTVTLRPRRNPGSVLPSVPLLAACSGEIPEAGDDVALVLWGDKPGLCLGPYDRPVTPPLANCLTTTAQTFTAQAYTAATYVTLSLTHRVTSFIMFSLTVNRYPTAGVRTLHHTLRIYIDGVATSTYVTASSVAINTWNPGMSLVGRSDGSFAPGTRTVQLYVYVYNAGDGIALNNCNLTAWAVPA